MPVASLAWIVPAFCRATVSFVCIAIAAAPFAEIVPELKLFNVTTPCSTKMPNTSGPSAVAEIVPAFVMTLTLTAVMPKLSPLTVESVIMLYVLPVSPLLPKPKAPLFVVPVQVTVWLMSGGVAGALFTKQAACVRSVAASEASMMASAPTALP
jgi:hypothetical protein